MAGHSKFKNIMHRKGAQDKKRSALFSKLSKEITVAAKMGGTDPESNSRLRLAIQTAKGQSMPKANIDRAIQNSQAGDGDNYEEVRYEGFGPGGVSLIVDSLTDNRNRTASDVRAAFQKNGGNMGETGCVSHQFDRVGQIVYPIDVADSDTIFEAALEAGAENVESDDETHEIFCAAEDLNNVREALESNLGEAKSARLIWKAQIMVNVDEEAARKLMNLLDVLDDNDDVQNVYGNYDVPDEIMEKLGA